MMPSRMAQATIASLLILLGTLPGLAQLLPGYQPSIQPLEQSIRQYFYQPGTGYYREHAVRGSNDRPASYLWPLCGLIQAHAELEALDRKKRLPETVAIIQRYYDARPPAPGYASYPPPLGGGDRFYDDNQWIGIALMDSYFREKNKNYLATSKLIYRFMMTAYDTATGGGLYWEEGKLNTKNTCSNGPGIILALQLYKATKQKAYLDTALLLYNWVNGHLRDSAGLYLDNISVPGKKLDTRRYSYNTGTMLQSNVYLYELTKDPKYLQEAKVLARSAKDYFLASGRLRDGYWFSAVLLRGLQHLYQHDRDLTAIRAFAACVDHALQHNRNEQGLMTGKDPKAVDLTNQAGMLEILARLAWIDKVGAKPSKRRSNP